MSTSVKTAAFLVIAGVAAALSGCAIPQQSLSDDFGVALRTDLAAQIANPDAPDPGPAPASDGVRAALAQTRYQTNQVVKPSGSASDVGRQAGTGESKAP